MYFSALLLATCFASANPTPEPTNERDLIALVLIDALRPDHVGAYGYERPTTPTLDALAAHGVRFERVYANAPWTRPSTASFLTGLRASRHRVETAQSRLTAGIPTLAEALKRSGYTTAAFVANGNGGSLAGLQRGFDVFRDPTNSYTRSKRGKTYNGLPTGQFIVNDALKWLGDRTEPKIFLFLFLVDPHDPYRAPPELERQFLGELKGKPVRTPNWEYDNNYAEADRLATIAVYDAGVRFADDALGRFVKGLEDSPWGRSTHLFVTADHGEGFGEHNFYLHAHHFWEEVIRIPLIIASPRFTTPSVDNRLVEAIDVAVTIAALGGTDLPGSEGYSLLMPAMDTRIAYSEYNEFGIHRQAAIGERYKVIWQKPADAAWFDREVKRRALFPSVSFDKEVIHVYDLNSDPGEKNDLARLGALPAAAAELLAALRTYVDDRATTR